MRRGAGEADRRARRLLRSVVRRQRRHVAASVAAGLAWQGVAVAVPWVLEQAVDQGLVDAERSALVRWCGVLVVLGSVGWATDAARHWSVEQAGVGGAIDLRRRLTRRVLTMTDDDLAAIGHGDAGSRLVTDTWTVWQWLSGTATLVTSAFTLLAVSVILLGLDPALAAIGLAAVPLAGALALGTSRRHQARADASARAAGSYGAAVESALTGARTIKGLGAERQVLGGITAASRRLTRTSLRAADLEAWWLTWAAAIPTAAIAAGIWIGGVRVLDGSATVGTLLAFVAWMAQLVNATTTLTDRLASRGQALAAARRIAELLGPDSNEDDDPSDPPTVAGGDISCRGAAVRRGDRRVLAGADLDVPEGAWVAIVGATGAGKSSLLRVLAGLDEPADGSVRIGGIDASLAHRQGAVVLVPQGPLIVGGTVGDVLRSGLAGVADDEVWEAIRTAAAVDVVEQLGGLGGTVGDRGLSLSGGQRQRLAVAAALLRRPAVLLLDDPTSALDQDTERRLLGALRSSLPATTVVLATHRPAAAACCDAVYELAGGTVRRSSEDRSVHAR